MREIMRRLADWNGRRKGAQIIIYDGASDVEKTRSFLKGAFVGAGISVIAFALTAPSSMEPVLAEEISRRERLVEESNERAQQAMQIADVCLSTAQNLENTLSVYQSFLGSSGSGSRASSFLPAR